jgi:hypothetical protein
VRNAGDIQGPSKEGMDNRQPSRLGETLRVPDDAVHRLDGSGRAHIDNFNFELMLWYMCGCLRYSRQTPERVVS